VAEDSDLEKTESPSQRRLDKAREQGQVPLSRDLGAFLGTAVCIGVLALSGGWMGARMQTSLGQSLSFTANQALAPDAMSAALYAASADALLTMAPFFIAALAAAVASRLLLGSWTFASQRFMPDFSRLDPIAGVKRLLSLQSLVELIKSLVKSAVLAGLGYWVMVRSQGPILALGATNPQSGLGLLVPLLLDDVWVLIGGLAFIAALDVPYQLWHYYDQLKMTKEEVRQESRESEGDPQVKARIRSLQRQAARQRMMQAVPKADVVITNPTHYAVAIQYDPQNMRAPIVLAKGINRVALSIRELAAEHKVPTLEAPPLARALYRHSDLDKPIPAALYRAVAEVLAYVYQLKEYARTGRAAPQQPIDLAVPAELDPGVAQ
jgi:flagellar biosynthetic protein FlhB